MSVYFSVRGTNRKVVVDDRDAHKLDGRAITFSERHGRPVVYLKERQRSYPVHRVVLGVHEGEGRFSVVNGDFFDCRRKNIYRSGLREWYSTGHAHLRKSGVKVKTTKKAETETKPNGKPTKIVVGLDEETIGMITMLALVGKTNVDDVCRVAISNYVDGLKEVILDYATT